MMKRDGENFKMQLKGSTAAVCNQFDDQTGRIGHQPSGDNLEAKHVQAALIFGDAIHRNEVEIMREIVPSLDLMVVMELLQGNSFDLERSIDAALALMASLAAEDGRAVLSDSYSLSGNSGNLAMTSIAQPSRKVIESATKESFSSTPSCTSPSSSSSSTILGLGSGTISLTKKAAGMSNNEVNMDASFRLSIKDTVPKENAKEFRGVPMLLSERFLSAPRFRLVINKHTNASTDFTIYFKRKIEKIGITIQESDSEIRIHTLHAKSPSEPLLALESGIKINDILTGINFEYFCPGAEVQDIIDILHLTGTFITLHFSRRYIPEDIQVQSYLSPHHKFARMLMDQTIIPKEKAGNVTTALRRLKERSLSWDSNAVSQRIKGWKLDSFLKVGPRYRTNSVLTPDRSNLLNSRGELSGSGSGSGQGSGFGSSSSANSRSQASRRASGDFPVRAHNNNKNNNSNNSNNSSNNNNNNNSSSSNNNSSSSSSRSSSSRSSSSFIDPARHLRPAISVRVIRAEERADHVVYVIWVMDVRSGAEWFVRRRFREFHDFKDVSKFHTLIFISITLLFTTGFYCLLLLISLIMSLIYPSMKLICLPMSLIFLSMLLIYLSFIMIYLSLILIK